MNVQLITGNECKTRSRNKNKIRLENIKLHPGTSHELWWEMHNRLSAANSRF